MVTTTVVKMAGEAANPLVPAWFDVAFSLIPLIVVATMVIGLVSIARNYRQLTTLESLGWSAFVVFAPVLGTVVWLTSGRRVAADGASHE